MHDLSPELAVFASLLDAQPAPARDTFNYCLCLLMVEAGKMRLVKTLPGESGEICVFETTVGDRFSVPWPAMSKKDEATLIAVLRNILDEEGTL